jgi:hypothetical protein
MLIVMQSTLGASWGVSKQRIIGTTLGAESGGLLASYFEPGLIVFGAATFALGLICAILRLDQSAYRFASITTYDYRARGARRSAVAHRSSPFRRGLTGHCGRSCPNCALAGA